MCAGVLFSQQHTRDKAAIRVERSTKTHRISELLRFKVEKSSVT